MLTGVHLETLLRAEVGTGKELVQLSEILKNQIAEGTKLIQNRIVGYITTFWDEPLCLELLF